MQLQRHINSLHEIMDFIFSSVFVRRYRDICADVRAICLAELGVWMKGYRFVETEGWEVLKCLSNFLVMYIQFVYDVAKFRYF